MSSARGRTFSPDTRKIKKDKYQLLRSDSGPQWDTGGGAAAGVPAHGDTRTQASVVNRCPRAMDHRCRDEERVHEPVEAVRHTGTETRRSSPSDPLRPIKLKMIPRNVQVCRSASASGPSGGTNGGGGRHLATRSPSVPCTSASVTNPAAAARATHTAVIHASGAHSLFRNPSAFMPPQQGFQAPTSFPSTIMRGGRRCSSPQTPMLSGSIPYMGRIPPRSAQTSPSGPKSPKLTSSNSDPWSAMIIKNYRAQSICGGIPPGEMDWLPAPSPCSRKSSWSSVSTDNDTSSPCW
ncbi:uncharacterized protein [Procambarus clarkii]|uniref:uncharacterized protein n=1 Tax=Procambarus clarkii TaxID=6728 RepID=UPI003742C013